MLTFKSTMKVTIPDIGIELCNEILKMAISTKVVGTFKAKDGDCDLIKAKLPCKAGYLPCKIINLNDESPIFDHGLGKIHMSENLVVVRYSFKKESEILIFRDELELGYFIYNRYLNAHYKYYKSEFTAKIPDRFLPIKHTRIYKYFKYKVFYIKVIDSILSIYLRNNRYQILSVYENISESFLEVDENSSTIFSDSFDESSDASYDSYHGVVITNTGELYDIILIEGETSEVLVSREELESVLSHGLDENIIERITELVLTKAMNNEYKTESLYDGFAYNSKNARAQIDL